jgi:deoxyhypusine synthase
MGPRIEPAPLGTEGALNAVVAAMTAYNGGRLREACHLLVAKMLAPETTVGLSLTGALTPTGLGISCLIPLIHSGFVDWIVSTGANLYHDAHYGLGMSLHQGGPFHDDRTLREEGIIRIYDILFDYQVLLDTDAFFREIIQAPEFQQEMSTARFHHLCGRYLLERERQLGIGPTSLLAAAAQAEVPIFTSSPGDSSIGMNVAAAELRGSRLRLNPSADVLESTAIVYDAKGSGGRTAVWILGGGSPKNFLLQTEPQIQEVLGLEEVGHDYFLQVTDARPDTGGLSGATPSEAVSWGKIDPGQLPDTVVVYADSTICLPVLTAYALHNHPPRRLRRLMPRLEAMVTRLRQADRERNPEEYGG